METPIRAAILLNRSHSAFSTVSKKWLDAGDRLAHGDWRSGDLIRPEYDSFARVLDPEAVVLGTGGRFDPGRLRGCDLLLWEWGWTEAPARAVLEIRSRLDIALLMFPGQLDRFWRELDCRGLRVHLEAVAATAAIGVMLDETRPFYRSLAPHAHVFPMPVPVDVERLAALAAPSGRGDPNRVLLSAPTRITGASSQMHICTYLAFRDLLRARPRLEGLCFVYSRAERAEAEAVFRELGLSSRIEIRPYLRPLARFIRKVKGCYAGMCLSQGLVQGRIALLAACAGLPMVLSDDIETHRRLYPRSSVKWYDTAAAAELCLQMLEDQRFHAAVAARARAEVAYYDVASCRRRMLDAVAVLQSRGALRRGAAAGAGA
jgi:hypothetical protein